MVSPKALIFSASCSTLPGVFVPPGGVQAGTSQVHSREWNVGKGS